MAKDTPLVNQKTEHDDSDIPFGDPSFVPPKDEPTPKRVTGNPMAALAKEENAARASGESLMGRIHDSGLRKEIYLAVIQGFAARGELSRRLPGTQLGVTTDADVQSICRHAAGVAAFAYEAAKAARI